MGGVPKRALLLTAAAMGFFRARAVEPESSSYVASTAGIFAILLLAKAFWEIIVYPHFLSRLRVLPQPEGSNFILGHFRRIFKEPTGEPHRDWIDNVPNDGIIYYRWLFNDPRVLVADPKAMGEVLVTKSYEFIKPKRLREGLGRLLGVGILLAEGQEHKRQRKLLMPAFNFRHVKDLYPIFWSKSLEMTTAIAANISASSSPSAGETVIDIREWASRSTLDIIGVAGMGKDFDAVSNPNNELNETYRKIFGSNRNAQVIQLLLGFLPHWLAASLPLKRNDEIGNAINTIKNVAASLVAEKRSKLASGAAHDTDILSVALESGGFSDADLVNQLMTFLAAGHETTASALTWAVYCLCRHPDVQSRLRTEIRTELASFLQPGAAPPMTSTEIDRLPYLNAVLNETMRIFPPVPLTLREAATDTTIQGQFVPAGTTVVICPWAINTSKHLWGDDAREFVPERWLKPGTANSGGAESNYAIGTFLHGPRSCIGKDFAKAEFACLVAAMVARFDMRFEDEGYVLGIQGGITASPKGGLRVRVREVGGV
ncbi:cytochrome p450 [Pyrenophora seminiperda CCB06]|uniref:Cytochrome p450 n=1 Tax=Pyrenophora seminiperda CCB06 TaxID=1302712 RepID=A0A3M7M2T3_9PLEO|nr:cytochrome p450 [Pyrenophora seminiperda CCB06]